MPCDGANVIGLLLVRGMAMPGIGDFVLAVLSGGALLGLRRGNGATWLPPALASAVDARRRAATLVLSARVGLFSAMEIARDGPAPICSLICAMRPSASPLVGSTCKMSLQTAIACTRKPPCA